MWTTTGQVFQTSPRATQVKLLAGTGWCDRVADVRFRSFPYGIVEVFAHVQVSDFCETVRGSGRDGLRCNLCAGLRRPRPHSCSRRGGNTHPCGSLASGSSASPRGCSGWRCNVWNACRKSVLLECAACRNAPRRFSFEWTGSGIWPVGCGNRERLWFRLRMQSRRKLLGQWRLRTASRLLRRSQPGTHQRRGQPWHAILSRGGSESGGSGRPLLSPLWPRLLPSFKCRILPVPLVQLPRPVVLPRPPEFQSRHESPVVD